MGNSIAVEMVRRQQQADEGVVRSILYTREGGPLPEDPIRILEVSEDTIACGIIPIYLGPQKAFPASIIIQVTPDEFQAIQQGTLALPEGWDQVGETFPRPTVKSDSKDRVLRLERTLAAERGELVGSPSEGWVPPTASCRAWRKSDGNWLCEVFKPEGGLDWHWQIWRLWAGATEDEHVGRSTYALDAMEAVDAELKRGRSS